MTSRSYGLLTTTLLLFVLINDTNAKPYRRTGYKYDTLLNPISRLYFQHQRNTASRSIRPGNAEPVEVALISNTPPSRKFEIEIAKEPFGLNQLNKVHKSNKLQNPENHVYKVDIVRVPEAPTSQASMRKTLKRILHRISV